MTASGEIGDNAQKVAEMGLERGFLQRQMGHLVRKVLLVHIRKQKYAKYGASIVNQKQVLNLSYKRYSSLL